MGDGCILRQQTHMCNHICWKSNAQLAQLLTKSKTCFEIFHLERCKGLWYLHKRFTTNGSGQREYSRTETWNGNQSHEVYKELYRLYDIPCQKKEEGRKLRRLMTQIIMMITKKKKNRMKKIMIAVPKKRKIIKAMRFPKVAANNDQLHH